MAVSVGAFFSRRRVPTFGEGNGREDHPFAFSYETRHLLRKWVTTCGWRNEALAVRFAIREYGQNGHFRRSKLEDDISQGRQK